ncbi:MAG: hypothetical protein WCK65_06235, partial [Rhodospirillaceae bacterium]
AHRLAGAGGTGMKRPSARAPKASSSSSLRETVRAVLDARSELELNVREDRVVLEGALVEALRARPEAAYLRHLFSHAPNAGTRIVVDTAEGTYLERAKT